MLNKYQKYVVGQAANKLRSGRYYWARERVALTAALVPCKIDSEDAMYFDIFGLIDRANYDAGFVTLRISPIFEEIKKAIVAGSIGDTAATNLQQWNDSPNTEYADVLRVLDIVAAGAISSTTYAKEAAE